MPITPADVPKLTREPKPISKTVPKVRLAVYGDGGVGKTTLALTFPKPLVVDTDGGLEGDAVTDITADAWTPEQWQDLNALYFWLKEKVSKGGYETIVIDSGDTLATFVRMEAMSQKTRNRPENAHLTTLVQPEQPDYGKVEAAMTAFFTNLRLLNVNVVVTFGVREPDPEKGRLRRTFDVQPAVAQMFEHWANIYGELVVVVKDGKEHRLLHTSASDPLRKNKTRFSALRPGVPNPTYAKMRSAIQKSLTAASTTTTTTKETSK